MNTAGSGVGRPSLGSRACKCRIAAPASAAAIDCSAISAGAIGRYSLMLGVWMAPVTAQLMMILAKAFLLVFRRVRNAGSGSTPKRRRRPPHRQPAGRRAAFSGHCATC